MEIRNAGLADVQVMSQIHCESWKNAYQGLVPQPFLQALKPDHWESTFIQWFSGQEAKGKVICHGDTVVGTAVYSPARDGAYEGFGELISIYLLPEYTGKGYGKALLKAALQEMKEDGYEKVYLWVLENNDRGRKFYESCGFEPVEEYHSFEVVDRSLRDIRYVGELGAMDL